VRLEPKRDYYDVLEVAKDADAKTIKRAFLKKARVLHPDVSDDPHAEEKFKEVNEAYSVLSDEQKRSNYDRYGDASGPSGYGSDYVDVSDIFGGSGFGINDIFDSFFGGGASRGGHVTRTRGRDMGIRLAITLEEAAAGCRKTISYDRLAPCDDCGGTGFSEGGSLKPCGRCKGTGVVTTVQRTIFGQMQSQATCPDCGGTGQVVDKPCETCDGQGRTPSKETVVVEVPAGVRTGDTVRVKDKGETGVRGDSSGDLVVSIEVLQHDRFERQDDDLYCAVTVDSLQAIVGTSVSIDGIFAGERVEIKVPAGCQYGSQVVAEHRGMPRKGRTSRGRLVAVIRIETPTDLTRTQMLDVAALVAGRTLSTVEAGSASSEERAEREGASYSKENMAEHFAAEAENDLRWDVPENPFKQGGNQAGKTGKGKKGRRR